MLNFKALLIIISTTILFSCINQTNTGSHKAKKPDFYGKVKEVNHYINCDYKITNINHSNLINACELLSRTVRYSESGILIEELIYDFGSEVVSQSELVRHNVYILDQNNNIIEERFRQYSEIFSHDIKYLYTYDKNNNLIETVRFSERVLEHRIEYYYSDNLLVEKKHYNKENNLDRQTAYKYNRKSRLKYESVVDGFGNKLHYSKYKYQLNGKLKSESYYKKGKLVNVYQQVQVDDPNIIRDKMGNIIERIESDGSTKIVYEYDIFGNKVMESHYYDDKWHYTDRWFYNENNLLIKKEYSWWNDKYPYLRRTSYITNDPFGNAIIWKSVLSTTGQVDWQYSIIDYWE